MRPPPQILGLAILSVIVGVASVAGIVALNTGATPGVGALSLGFADGYEARAYELLQDKPSPEDIDRAALLAEKALAISPYDNTARLRLAYIDSLRDGYAGPRAVRLFVQSYDLLPFDQNVAAWRIRFGLEHWTELSPQARGLVHDEVMMFARVGSIDPPVRKILGSIRNPSGRLAGALWLHQLGG